MKKSLFLMAAASALMLTACTSESDVLQSATKQEVPKAVGFDVYMPQVTNVTRAGSPEGVMTTDKLKTAEKGFGVFAYYHDNSTYASGTSTPNFMYNEHIHWTDGWTYSPLKYWPNETDNDSQTDPATIPEDRIDKVSFFAYAPYVSTGTGGTLNNSHTSYYDSKDFWDTSEPQTYGIMAIQKAVANDPIVEWKYSSDVDKNVDLLWGVASKGMDYTAVNGTTVPTHFGFPLTNLVKPDKDMKIKFLFQHALSRIGLTVVSAIDQIAAGDDGGKFNSDQTRVLIEDVQVWGNFGIQGKLNLNNDVENVARWLEGVTKSNSNSSAPLFKFQNGIGDGTPNKLIAKDVRYTTSTVADYAAFKALNEGVLPSEKVLIQGDIDANKKVVAPDFVQGKKFYKVDDGELVLATTTASEAVDAYVQEGTFNTVGNIFTCVFTTSADSKVPMSGTTPVYYKLPLVNKVVGTGENMIAADALYYERSGAGTADDPYVFTCKQAAANITENVEGKYWVKNVETPVQITAADYTGDCYTGMLPRYFMVVPSEYPYVKGTTETSITVKIKYHVMTYDEKLTGNISDVVNEIVKTIPVQLYSGKSYNLKLVLGLTSVKLDAVVGDWQVGDDAEVNLPQNN